MTHKEKKKLQKKGRFGKKNRETKRKTDRPTVRQTDR